jgi:hypothetical protein
MGIKTSFCPFHCSKLGKNISEFHVPFGVKEMNVSLSHVLILQDTALSGEKTSLNPLDNSLAGILGEKNVGTPISENSPQTFWAVGKK